MRLYEYYNTDSIIHRLNPLVKLLWLVLITFIVFIISGIQQLLVLAIILFFLVLFSRIPFNYLFYYLKTILFFLLLTYALLFIVTQENIFHGIVFLTKITILVISMVVFVLTTSKKELVASLIKLGIPYSFAFTLAIAIQFMPLMLKDLQEVLRAQRSRGHKLMINIFKPLKSAQSYYPVVIPAFILLFKRAFELSLSAEARGFTPKIYSNKKILFGLGDGISVVLLALLVIYAVII
jgi:energy-coupling factor transport system permease protein